ncbi:hypothetical protein [Pseudoduganella chitinolytica]|uniref:Uncharacterized protein n=1 Tax=Pseudoduganella chitinolytica TaxID=34070 RepID=A0ABY8B9E0_9BURK|nr:hypothetical protein [Pseudoduganella chitinolytica]WEF31357.1 hypothetical protein PX653_18055 [Pseudoduganella chitinolytica]
MLSMNTLKLISALLMAATLGVGGGRIAVAKDITAPVKASAANTEAGQFFELSVDGKSLPMDVGRPTEAHFVRASVTANRVFSFSAGDRKSNFMLAVAVGARPGQALIPGVYESYNCDQDHACDDPPTPSENQLTAVIMNHADIPMQVGDLKEALKARKLGLAPLLVTITKVEDVNLKAIGPRKRVQGSFKGQLAYVKNDAHNVPHVVGRVKEVEGKFDVYAVIYTD